MNLIEKKKVESKEGEKVQRRDRRKANLTTTGAYSCQVKEINLIKFDERLNVRVAAATTLC